MAFPFLDLILAFSNHTTDEWKDAGGDRLYICQEQSSTNYTIRHLWLVSRLRIKGRAPGRPGRARLVYCAAYRAAIYQIISITALRSFFGWDGCRNN